MSADPIPVRAAVALFGLCARALPAGFRDLFGSEMCGAFADEAREEYRDRGRLALLRATIRALADVARSAGDGRWRLARRRAARAQIHALAAPGHPTRGEPMNALWQDLRYGCRSFTRQPGFTIVAVLMLTVGIGANTAIFTLLNAALLRPLPYPDPDRLVRVWGENIVSSDFRINVNPLDALDWRRGSPALESLALWVSTTQSLTGTGDPVALPVALVSPGFFDVLKTPPALGRGFGREHEDPGRATDVIVTDGFWRQTLGADPDVLGRAIVLSDQTCTIIGVLSPDFVSPGTGAAVEPPIWRPLVVTPDSGRGGHFARAIARLAPGGSIAAAQAQVDAVAERLSREFPSTNLGARARLEPLQAAISGDTRPALLVLMAAVGVVLLIACANVANLLLARAAVREREIALRGALGASRRRLVAQLMTESLLLGLVASAAGALAGVVAVEAMPRWLADQLPTVMAARVDLRVLAFTVALSLATVVLFGLVPALLASRHDLRGALAAGAPGAGGGPRRIQSTLLVLEAALALVLLVAATLLVESLVRLQRTDPGFDTEQVLTFRLALPRTRYPDAARRRAFFSGTVARVRALPGVAAAGAVNMSPLTPRYSCDSFGLADRPAPPAGQEPCAESRAATADYFRAMGIPLRSGRVFDGSERPDGPLVIVVSETMARKYWPDGGALGQRFKWGCVACDTPWLTVIGVVGDVKHYSLEEDAPPEVYSPLEQTGSSAMTVAVRTSRDPASLAGEVRDVVRSLDPALAVSEMFTTRELVGRATAAPAFRTQLLTAFALVALGLAVAGVYGVLSFFVAQRRREIGIRLALGATPGGVRRYIIRRGLSAAALGTIIGLAAAVPLMRLLGDLLFGVKPDDPMAFAAGPLLLLGAALLACYLPARRATLLDPVATIRTD